MKKGIVVKAAEKDTLHITQKMIASLKRLYEVEGLTGCDHLFRLILEHPASTKQERSRLVVELMKVLYKIEICQDGCFNDLDTKESCTCSCGGFSITIPFRA